jgi:hypothetical protein
VVMLCAGRDAACEKAHRQKRDEEYRDSQLQNFPLCV